MKVDEKFDEFLNYVFNMIGVYEEKVCKDITNGALTSKEIRLIESVLTLEKEGNVNLGDLASFVFLTPSALSITISTLIKKGFLKKYKKKGDKRYTYVKVTDEGRQVSNVHRAYHAKLFNYVYKQCTPEDLHSFITVIKNVEHILGGK